MSNEATDRINRLRERLINTEPVICPDRAMLWTMSFKKSEGLPTVVRAALALKETLSGMTIMIHDDELIVGNQGSALRAAPLHPQINLWFLDELNRFEMRDGSKFLISDETKQKLASTMEYWRGKNVFDRTQAMLSKAAKESATANVFTCNYTMTKGTGHFLLNFEKVLSIGFKGIQEECEQHLSTLDYSNPDDFDKISVYQAFIIVCEAVGIFAHRFAALARQMVDQTRDTRRQRELMTIAENCDWVPENPPRNYYEALQCIWFQQLIAQIESDGTGLSIGRLDYFLNRFYEKDIIEGVITQDFAEELLDSFWLKCGEIIEVWNEEDSKFFGGHPISQAITLGGTHADGSDSTNKITYMSLETTIKIRLPQPSICVRVHKNSPHDYLLKCAEVIRYGLGMPAVYNDEIAIPSLMNRGVKMEDARRNFGVAGCVEMGLQGQMCHFANSGYFNFIKCLEVTLNNGVDPITGMKVGPETGDPRDFKHFTELVAAYNKQMSYALKLMVATTNIVNTMHARYVTLPFISTFTEDCVGRGKEVHDGGALYNHDGPQGVGLADLADSMAAIKKLVFEEQTINMDDLLKALAADFEGYDDLRISLIKDVPHYGNNIPYVDSLAREFSTRFCQEVSQYTNLRGGPFVPGLYSVSANVPIGAYCGASPNGRKARMPVAEACSPTHGSETQGPTQSALSVAHLDHILVTNGSQYNQKYHPSAFANQKGLESLVSLIKTYFEAGGYHIQFNVVSADLLREAQKQPEKYKDIVVRVAGYTAFFVDLNTATQNDIIDRTELSLN